MCCILERTGSFDDQIYARSIPDMEEYAKDPPSLPAQLRWIVLNGVYKYLTILSISSPYPYYIYVYIYMYGIW